MTFGVHFLWWAETNCYDGSVFNSDTCLIIETIIQRALCSYGVRCFESY